MAVDTLMAEVDAPCQYTGKQSDNNGLRTEDMDIDWDKRRADLDDLYRDVLSCVNREQLDRGVEAYKRDLPQLLRDQKEHYLVAYDGDTRVGLEKTRVELLRELKKNGLSKNKHLFIKSVKALDDRCENMSSYSQG